MKTYDFTPMTPASCSLPDMTVCMQHGNLGTLEGITSAVCVKVLFSISIRRDYFSIQINMTVWQHKIYQRKVYK